MAYDSDRLESIRAALSYSAEDRRNNRPNPAKFPIEGDLYRNLSAYRAKLEVYKRFRADEASGNGHSAVLRDDPLAQLKQRFLARYPYFTSNSFAATVGAYWDEERSYKETVLARARELVAIPGQTPEALGSAFLELLQKPPANFIGWRTFSQIKAAGEQSAKEIATVIGQMIMDPGDVAELVGTCATSLHPLLKRGTSGASASSQVRTLLSATLALVRPDEAIIVKTQVMQRASRLLIGRPIFREAIVTMAEYRELLALAERIFVVMRDEWQWAPKDLWDVQGFLWVTDEQYQQDSEAEDDEEGQAAVERTPPVTAPPPASRPAPPPTNLILYGPPGTGKTYATAARAVELCDGALLSADRDAVMKRYRQLVERRRISFVTFHQSYAYEDFVEGLRPVTGNDDDGDTATSFGFSLKPQPGIFRQIADLARGNRGRVLDASALDRNRQVFKMSLGRSGEEEGVRLFKDAIQGGFVVLGWGGDVDWSDPKYSTFPSIRERWQEVDKDATGNDSNIKQIYTLRANMQVGDLVVISDGNRKFRAIGEITGPYRFVPNYVSTFNHRRPVKWLWHSDEGQPRELIYGKEFTQVSAYQLQPSKIDWPALQQVVSGGGEGGRTDGVPEPFVLIIDEINRANVSKVFGELITLVEPDKRLGGENALTVTLPYSKETFGVPSNLHIIGTMNTADRSIALLDTALRRRFEFEELMPDPTVLRVASDETGVDLVAVLNGLNTRLECLFDREHQIGHAFFVGCRKIEDVARVMRTKIIPLLAEYFYEDWEKMRLVLGETRDEGTFIRRVRLGMPAFSEGIEPDQERWRYEIHKIDYPLESYEQLKG